MAEALAFRGTVLPEGERATVVVVGGRVRRGGDAAATLVVSGGWLVPGLVDAHCHVGLGPGGGEDEEGQERQAVADRDSGVLALRDCGVPVDTRWIDDRTDLPQVVRAGRHIGRPKRYLRGVGVEVEPADLVAEVEAQASRGDGWVKLVGDWIDRDRGDLAPLWPREALEPAIARAHELGARVTAHCFGEDALPDLLGAGIDCIEHGTGLSEELLDLMAQRQVGLVPTLINTARFPVFAERGHRFPRYAEHMLALHRRRHETVRAAHEAGVPVYAGTDAGSELPHGQIAREVLALHEAGLAPREALAAASWRAREWLRVPDGLSEGSVASFVVYPEDPLVDLAVLQHPSHVVLRGHVFRL